MANKISVTILTKNSQKYIYECLKALEKFDEIIILDNGSSDETLHIASQFENVSIYKNAFIGFGPLKNLAISHARNDWILSVDSDEIFSQDLVDEILNKELSETTIYSIQRDNYYKEKLVKCCGWQNDYVNRLFNKKTTKFNDKPVHESLLLENVKVEKLQHRFKHYSFNNPSELLQKMDKYSSLTHKSTLIKRVLLHSKHLLEELLLLSKTIFFKKASCVVMKA